MPDVRSMRRKRVADGKDDREWPHGDDAKMPAMCMAFMVVTPALLGVAVGLMIGRSTTRAR